MSNFKKKINKAVLGTTTSMSILTGCAVDNRVNDNINVVSKTDVQGDMVVDIDSSYKEGLSKVTGRALDYNYTVNDLKMIGPNLDVIVVGDYSLDWLNYCDNVQSLLIRLENEGAKDVLKDVKKMDNLSFFHLANYDGTFFNSNDLSFLNKDKIKGLFLYGNLILDQDFLYNFNNLSLLSFCGESVFNFNINGIGKLDNLSSLFLGNTPYDIAIYVDMDDYNRLIDRDIEVIFDEDANKDKFLNASGRLDDIASSLGLDTDISEEEKLKRVILYTLDNFNYSDEVREALNNGDIPDVSRFYDGGDNMIIDINENRYEINIDNERKVVNAGALVGILMALGCAKRAYNKNIKKKGRMVGR